MRKWKIAPILLIVLLPSIIFAPWAYYYFSLPSVQTLNESENINLAFNSWQLNSEMALSKQEKIPHKEFKCSVCYPHQEDSKECKDRMSSWISRSLNFGDSNERQIFNHVKNYYLAKALLTKYDDDTFYRLYLAFASKSLEANSIEQACENKFRKSCKDLTFEETVDLEIAVRIGKDAGQADELRKNINLFCAK